MKGDRAIESAADKPDPGSGDTAARRPAAPSGPQHGSRKQNGGPSPLAVAGAAFAVGTVLAKLIDWRSHAHPRR